MPSSKPIPSGSVPAAAGAPAADAASGPGQPGTPADPADLLPRLAALSLQDGGVPAGCSILVALSGGADSVALLDVLARLREQRDLRLVAAHLDHALRPGSQRDVVFCRQLCDRLGVPLRTHRIDVAAAARRCGEGLEAAGRRARYGWLRQLRAAEGLERIATGHHLDDHVETLLMWLFRGAGLTGMRGIAPRRGRLLRPLRQFRRDELRAYLRWRGLEHLEDPTNAEPRFARNRIRHELLPQLETLFGPGVSARLERFSRLATAEVGLLQAVTQEALQQCATSVGPAELELRRETFLALHPVLRAHVLRAALRQLRARTVAVVAQVAPPASPLGAAWTPAGPAAVADLGALEAPAGPQRWTAATAARLLCFAKTGRAGARTPLPGGGWLKVERGLLRLLSGAPDALELPARSRPKTSPRPQLGTGRRETCNTAGLGGDGAQGAAAGAGGDRPRGGTRSMPGSAPESTPENAPGTAPQNAGGSTPQEAVGSGPKEALGSTPGDSPAWRLQAELLPPCPEGFTLLTESSACFNVDTLRPPLRVREARGGDRMRPHGLVGHKRLARLYQERGIPSDLRPGMLVVEDQERIIWAVGVTTSEETRITSSTQRVLRLTLELDPLAGPQRRAQARPASGGISGPGPGGLRARKDPDSR
jgi:tRNA(Ile)-lysidine synthetase-like protein